MRPKNQWQRELVKIDESLPGITETQEKWAFKNCMPHQAIIYKNGRTVCLDCSEEFYNSTICPKCKIKLEVLTTKQRVFYSSTYLTFVSTWRGYQIIRHCIIYGYHKVGIKSQLSCREVSRVYFDKYGNYGIVGCYNQNTWSGDKWLGKIELRNPNSIRAHDFVGKYVYPRIRVLPIIKRNGYYGEIQGLTYYEIFESLLTDTRAETLIKAGQIDFFKAGCRYRTKARIIKYWSSIKICIRNNYKIRKVDDYLDYLDLLEFFNKDLYNAKYVCPLNLKKEHNKYVEKKRKWNLKRKIKDMKKQLRKDQREYYKKRKQFFDLEFTDGDIVVKPIKSVKQVMELGDMMNHCIYQNEYYKQDNSLLLYAKIKNIATETIEFDLERQKVVQSRGYDNDPTKYNRKIVRLVNKHKQEILKLNI